MFSPQLNVSACGLPATFGSQVVAPDLNGVFHTVWSPLTPVLRVDGQITATGIAASLACLGGGATGSLSATASGGQFQGSFTFNGSTGTLFASVQSSQSGGSTGGGSSGPPSSGSNDRGPTWRSTNPAIASVDGNGRAIGLAPGQTTIVAEFGNISCLTTNGCATLDVRDVTPPIIGDLSDIVAEATSPAGAVVAFTLPAAVDDFDPNPSVSANPPSGSSFPLGPHTVTVTAIDASGNSSTKTFTVTVRDTTPPSLSLPSNQVVEATGAAGAAVTFNASASDLVDGATTVNCVPASGSTFPLGPTTVTCSSSDTHGNTASGSFSVTVRDTTPPVIGSVSDLTVDATSPSGAVVTFSMPAAIDIVDPAPTVTAVPAPGSQFAIGTTAVTVTATDHSGNSAKATFNVTVLDAVQMTSNLLAMTRSAGFQQAGGLLQSVIDRAPRAGSADVASCNKLGAFINQVQAQSGKQVPQARAAVWLAEAGHIMATIACR